MTQTKSPLAWLGGKSRLANQIIDRIPAHTTYVEVFAGAAWVLFKKPESKVEIINDINRDLVTLYRCVKHHLPALIEQFKWLLVAREEFERFIKTPPETLTDIQRAARFYYISKSSFGARLTNPSWGVATTTHPRLNLLRLEEDLSQAHLRLSRTHIECKPYQEVITRFDKPDTFFYVDPPYWDCEGDYGKRHLVVAELPDGLFGSYWYDEVTSVPTSVPTRPIAQTLFFTEQSAMQSHRSTVERYCNDLSFKHEV